MAYRSNSRRGGFRPGRRSLVSRIVRVCLLVVVAFYVLVTLSLIALRWIDPVTTAVQAERRMQSWSSGVAYRKVYDYVPIEKIAPDLQHAVVAAEDARFFQHHGFDWKQVRIAAEEDLEQGKSRGASTITQQLVKNLYLGTSRTFIRKGIEFTIVPLAELLLSKKRILELYLNVIEWGPGIFGCEAAGEHYFHVTARQLKREQAVELASILPNPIRRKPGRMTEYDRAISGRMSQMGW